MKETYGEQGAVHLTSLARTKLILGTADRETAEYCSDFIGHREVRKNDEAYSYGYSQTFDAVGNVKKTTRFGTDGNSMDVLPLRDFDRSGRVVREQTPLAIGYITTVEGTTGSGGRLVITTYPDTGTRTEEYYRDGR